MSPEEVEKETQKRIDKHKGLAETIQNNRIYIYSVRYENEECIGMDTLRFHLEKKENWKVQSRIKL